MASLDCEPGAEGWDRDDRRSGCKVEESAGEHGEPGKHGDLIDANSRRVAVLHLDCLGEAAWG